MKPLIAVLILALGPTLLFAQPTIIIDGDGNYFYSGGGGTAVRVENIIRLPGAPDDPGPDDPPPNTRVDQVRVYSRDANDAENAPVIAAVVGQLAKGDYGDQGKAAWDAAMGVTLPAIGGETESRWRTWKANVEALAGGNFNAQFFRDVEAGVIAAYELDATAISDTLDYVDSGVDAETAAAELEGEHGRALDFAKIIELILAILQLLRDLGIL